MAKELVLVWGTHYSLRAMYPAHAREQLWRRLLVEKKQKDILYLSWVVYQTILSSVHTFLTGINTPHLNCSVPAVLSWLFSFSLLGGPLLHLIFGGDVSNLFLFRPYDLKSLSVCQKGDVLSQNLILELLKVLYLFPLILLLCKPPFLGFLPYFGLRYLSCLLSSILNIVGFCHLF